MAIKVYDFFEKVAHAGLSKSQRVFIGIVLAFMLGQTLYFIFLSQYGVLNPWCVGDWLINYRAGFMRRGLAGWLLLGGLHYWGVSPIIELQYFKTFCYLIIYGFTFYLIIFCHRPMFLYALILLSPACLLLPVNFPEAAGRKEIILFATVVLITCVSLIKRMKPSWVLLSIVLLVLTAIHDGLYFLFPVVLVYFDILFPSGKYGLSQTVLIYIPATFLLLFFAWQGPATNSQVYSIIDGFHGDRTIWDSGSIAFLRDGIWQALAHTLGSGGLTKKVGLFIAGLVLAISPLGLKVYYWRNGSDGLPFFYKMEFFKFGLAFAVVMQMALFCFALDWGRWLMADLLLMAWAALIVTSRHREPRDSGVSNEALPWSIFLSFLIVYLASWRTPHVYGGLHLPFWILPIKHYF